MAPSEARLLLLPGMGADERLLSRQREAFPNLIVPPWLPNDRGESLASYAARFAPVLAPHRAEWIGGVSFGGFVALELAKHLRPRGVVLIGSARSIAALRPGLRALAPFSIAAPSPHLVPKPILRALFRTIFGPIGDSHVAELTSQARAVDPSFLRWAIQAALSWTGVPKLSCPILHIHGDADRVLPRSRVAPTVTIAGAGHALNITHSREVNAAIAGFLDRT